MNWSRFKFNQHYKLTPPALLKMPNGTWVIRDWEWFAEEHGTAGNLTLCGPNTHRGRWAPSIRRDNFHSFQDGHLLLRGQLYLFDGGTGVEVSPFSPSCRKETEALLNRIQQLARASRKQ